MVTTSFMPITKIGNLPIGMIGFVFRKHFFKSLFFFDEAIFLHLSLFFFDFLIPFFAFTSFLTFNLFFRHIFAMFTKFLVSDFTFFYLHLFFSLSTIFISMNHTRA